MYYSSIFFASSDVNRTAVKVSLQQWDLPLTINVSLEGCEWKKIRRKEKKTLAQNVFWQKMKSWWSEDTDQNISARFSTLLIFTVGWALCGRSQPKHTWNVAILESGLYMALSLCPLSHHNASVLVAFGKFGKHESMMPLLSLSSLNV